MYKKFFCSFLKLEEYLTSVGRDLFMIMSVGRGRVGDVMIYEP